MTDRFDYFVVLAEMRTGSNFLESNLNAIDGIACYGEAYNPHFVGYPNVDNILGVTEHMREDDPLELIERLKTLPDALGGFRYFHDHDLRVLSPILDDPRCAKIILTRNPLDSYVSKKIAQATGQWKLTNFTRRKDAKARFDPAEFSEHVEILQEHQIMLLNHLQHSGQTAFYLDYDDLQSVDVMNGLAGWLGVSGRLDALDDRLKRQNPAPVQAKVENPDDMWLALANMDRFNLTRTPNFEPRRGPAVSGYFAGAVTPLLYLPVRGGPMPEVINWLADLDAVDAEGLIQGMNQKQLRQWKTGNPGFRSFTVLRHPVARAHAVFCRRILHRGPETYGAIRATLRRRYDLPLPKGNPDASYGIAEHRAAFTAFLEFLKANLSGQTTIRVDAEWASQSKTLAGLAELGAPDLILRETDMEQDLQSLARRLGRLRPPPVRPVPADMPFALSEIYDAVIERKARAVYARDYQQFGFADWALPEE